MNTEILERNFLALAQRSSDAAQLSGKTDYSHNIFFNESRNGYKIPFYKRDRTVAKPVHSTFDPVKEANRLFLENSYEGMVIVFGLGGGFHIRSLLTNRSITSLIIVENRADEVRTILGNIDLTDILLDQRVTLWISHDPSDFTNFLLTRYIPVLSGNLQTVSLKPRVYLDQEYFNTISDIIKEAINQITDDYTVQAHFGKRWFNNTLYNLGISEKTTQTLSPVSTAYITAAGPSLEKQLPVLRDVQGKDTIIATDTSLPVLMSNGIKPDLVISIDCQHISYNHFMQGYPEDVPLVLDLASPSFLTRIARKIFFFTSDHPFSKYVSQEFRKFPEIDTSGGNVTHAALSLAETLGARKIYLLGTDFSYPFGKPYARNTYIYPYFYARTSRFKDIESQIVSFVLHNKSIIREKTSKGFRYISKPMIYYKNSIEKKASHSTSHVVALPGDGVALNINSINRDNRRINRFVSAGRPVSSYRDFLTSYRNQILELPPLQGSVVTYLSSLNTQQRQTWITLLPVAAQFRKNSDSGEDAVKRSMEWCINSIDKVLLLEK